DERVLDRVDEVADVLATRHLAQAADDQLAGVVAGAVAAEAVGHHPQAGVLAHQDRVLVVAADLAGLGPAEGAARDRAHDAIPGARLPRRRCARSIATSEPASRNATKTSVVGRPRPTSTRLVIASLPALHHSPQPPGARCAQSAASIGAVMSGRESQ